jgi:hypothetical protein
MNRELPFVFILKSERTDEGSHRDVIIETLY